MDCIFCQIDRAILAETKLSPGLFDGFPPLTMRHIAPFNLSDLAKTVGAIDSQLKN
jgi:hypothetical protein